VKNENNNRDALKMRIRDNHPQVYLTLVSIIVALALEDLFSEVRGIYAGPGPDTTTVLLWLQIIGAFFTSFNVWVGYCQILITSRWVLGIWDALSVMSLLVILFLINSSVGASNATWWFCAVGAMLLAAAFILRINLQRAMSEPDNVTNALPPPNSWFVVLTAICGFLALSFGLLVFLDTVSVFVITLFAAIIALFAASWSFVWVKVWSKSVGLS